MAENSEDQFSKVAAKTAQIAGRPLAFGMAAGLVAAWLISGPLFGFSDTWNW
jgi:low affinity Fe/Cu permease